MVPYGVHERFLYINTSDISTRLLYISISDIRVEQPPRSFYVASDNGGVQSLDGESRIHRVHHRQVSIRRCPIDSGVVATDIKIPWRHHPQFHLHRSEAAALLDSSHVTTRQSHEAVWW
mmetsp:Transcript_16240/g.42747  ORF Transcript_16240/g.42747 Transcript_16240/m.42747 type:complete len:119 (-) Transcript_16240:12-368(-)